MVKHIEGDSEFQRIVNQSLENNPGYAANDVKFKPCPGGHPNPQVFTEGNKTVVMCSDPSCGWCAPSYSWNLQRGTGQAKGAKSRL